MIVSISLLALQYYIGFQMLDFSNTHVVNNSSIFDIFRIMYERTKDHTQSIRSVCSPTIHEHTYSNKHTCILVYNIYKHVIDYI